ALASPLLVMYRSSDYGQAWRRLPDLTTAPDRESLIVDTTPDKHRGTVYLTGGGAAIWRLGAGGDAFEGPIRLPSSPNHKIISLGNSVVLSDGTLVTQFVDFRIDATKQIINDGKPKGSVEVATSSDGGRSISVATKVGDYNSIG